MKIAYVRPYDGESEIVNTELAEHTVLFVEAITELPAEVRQEIEVISVFVDYQVTLEVLDLLPNLKFIATRSAGYDHIDTNVTAERGIIVARVPHYGTRTVAEYAIALMFALSRNAFRSYTDVQDDSRVVNFESYEGFDLCGKTLGVVGTGAIGRNVCEIATGIGMNVLAFDVTPDQVFGTACGITYMSLDDVLAQSDIVTLHVPSIPQTHHLLNEEKLRLMKVGSYLINTARGDIVDTKALVKVLQQKHLAGAGLDVLEGEHELREEAELFVSGTTRPELWETLVANHTLIDMPNVIVTPHIAFNTKEAKREITDSTIENIKQYTQGTPHNTI